MKSAIIFLSFTMVGFLIGNFRPDPRDPSEDGGEPGAITFLGQHPGDSPGASTETLTGQHSGSRHSRENLLAWIVDSKDSGLRLAAMREWAKSDPDGSGIRALFKNEFTKEAWEILSVWSEEHPKEAVEMALEWFPQVQAGADTPTLFVTQSLKSMLLEGDGSVIPLANQIPASLGGLEYSFDGSRESTEGWSEAKITQRLSLIEQIDSPDIKFELAAYSTDLLQSWAKIDPDATLNWCEYHLPSVRQFDSRKLVFESLFSSDAASAANWVDSMWERTGDGSWPKMLLGSTLSASPGDPFTSLPDADIRILQKWIRQQNRDEMRMLVKNSPELYETYLNLIGEEPNGDDWKSIRDHVGLSWPITDPEQAKAWASQLKYNLSSSRPTDHLLSALDLLHQSGEELTPAAARNLAFILADRDPRAALRLASDLPDHLAIEAADSALSSWFRSEPKAAREYVDGLPDTEFRRYAVERIAQDWLAKDPEPAIKWVNQMPRGIDKDIGHREIASTFLRRNPIRAYHHANAIDHSVIRDEALESVFEVLFQRDPDRANELLGKANLDLDRREEIARGAQQR